MFHKYSYMQYAHNCLCDDLNQKLQDCMWTDMNQIDTAYLTRPYFFLSQYETKNSGLGCKTSNKKQP